MTGWSGAGYIILDPDTGAGAYKISGGANGSFLLGLFIGMSLVALLIASVASGTVVVVANVLASIALNSAFLSLMDLSLVNEGFDFHCFASGLLWGLGAVFFAFGLIGITGNTVLAALTGGLGLAVAWDDLPSPNQCTFGG